MATRELYRFDDEPASTLLQFLGRRFKILDLQRDRAVLVSFVASF